MLASSTRTLVAVLLGVAGLSIGTYLLVVGDSSAWPLMGAGALCLAAVLAVRTAGQRLERRRGGKR